MRRFLLSVGFAAAMTISCCFAQETLPSAPESQKPSWHERMTLKLQDVRDLPAEWIIGPYVPTTGLLHPLTNLQRLDVYYHQTFLTAGAYVFRIAGAGIDQARGSPSQWGGGMEGYGKRLGSRYGTFVIASTFHAFGNGVMGYEPRYDLCRCSHFWPRTKHAIARNFAVYNRTERELRPAIPLYAGSFGAGMISSVWLPGPRNAWKQGGYAALEQAGFGSVYNITSEFAIDILRKITGNRYPKELH